MLLHVNVLPLLRNIDGVIWIVDLHRRQREKNLIYMTYTCNLRSHYKPISTTEARIQITCILCGVTDGVYMHLHPQIYIEILQENCM